jgi:pSer/pThr/pTyr-binding forkhead associated (FHA) protein
MASRSMIKVGRGHDCQVRVTDISVSRLHAFFRKSSEGFFLLEDNASKFGTLIQVRKPYFLIRD